MHAWCSQNINLATKAVEPGCVKFQQIECLASRRADDRKNISNILNALRAKHRITVHISGTGGSCHGTLG